MQELFSNVLSFLDSPQALAGLRAIMMLMVGVMVARLTSIGLSRLLRNHLDEHRTMIVRRAAFTSIIALFVVSAMHQLGFNLGVLLGAAGIASVAIGFAAQTSTSNLISGLFLIGEQSFRIGEVIKVGETTGEVLSIDLLSVKLRTFDNLFVRIPNEQLIKSQVTTLTRFPIRRYDMLIGVAYKEELGKVSEVLMEVADRNPACLEEPKPLFIFQGFADSALSIQFSVWAARENFLELRNTMAEQIKSAFDQAGIQIPFPHRTLFAGTDGDPFPVQIVPRDS